jgi:hypothetical protein
MPQRECKEIGIGAAEHKDFEEHKSDVYATCGFHIYAIAIDCPAWQFMVPSCYKIIRSPHMRPRH